MKDFLQILKKIHKKITFGIRKKMIFWFVFFSLFLLVAIGIFNGKLLDDVIGTIYRNHADCVYSMLTEYIDEYDITNFNEKGLMDHNYRSQLVIINRLQKTMDIVKIYVLIPYEDKVGVIYESDTNYDELVEKYHGKEVKDEDGKYVGIVFGGYSSETEKNGILNDQRIIKYQSESIFKLDLNLNNEDLSKQCYEFTYPIMNKNNERVATIVIQDSYLEVWAISLAYNVFFIFVTGFCMFVFATLMIGYISSVYISPIKVMAEAATSSIDVNDEQQGDAHYHAFSDMNYKDNNTELDYLKNAFVGFENSINEYTENIKNMTAERERINTELDLAKSIQQGYLPASFPTGSEFQIHAMNVPAKEVGGDFFDCRVIDDNHIAVIMADVSGKGVPAALFMMLSKTMLTGQFAYHKSPAKILEIVNNRLCENNSEALFVTVWLGIIDITTGEITAANAGHENPILVRDGKAVHLDYEPGFVLGGIEMMEYEDHTIKMEKGDVLFLYTDGLTDATNSSDEMFGFDNLIATVEKSVNKVMPNNEAADEKAAEECVEAVYSEITNFSGDNSQFDDITMMVYINC